MNVRERTGNEWSNNARHVRQGVVTPPNVVAFLLIRQSVGDDGAIPISIGRVNVSKTLTAGTRRKEGKPVR